jgi:nucleotide-binding universal stress UspA family protein
VPIDFSKISQKALEYAVPLAKQFEAEITLLHAIEPLPYPMDFTYVPVGEHFPIKPLEEELNALAKSMIEPQLVKEVIVRLGAAFEVITNVAHDCEADLIVITTQWPYRPQACVHGKHRRTGRTIRPASGVRRPKMRTQDHLEEGLSSSLGICGRLSSARRDNGRCRRQRLLLS